jgi:hypothetical protein
LTCRREIQAPNNYVIDMHKQIFISEYEVEIAISTNLKTTDKNGPKNIT